MVSLSYIRADVPGRPLHVYQPSYNQKTSHASNKAEDLSCVKAGSCIPAASPSSDNASLVAEDNLLNAGADHG